MKLREILSIILINSLVFFALISIHEISHVAAGLILGCKNQVAVLLDSNFVGPYTESYCSGSNALIYVSSFLITMSFSLLFLFSKSSTRKLFLISAGLSVIFSSLDFSIVTSIQSMFYPIFFTGMAIIIVGEYFIAASFVNGEFIDLLDVEGEVV
jgi:hypothetical protein